MSTLVRGGTPLFQKASSSAALGGAPSYDCFYAVRIGNIKLVEHLVTSGACSVTATRWSGVTLLHRAASEGHAEIVDALCGLGADPAARTHRGLDTPLHLAMGAGHESAAEALLKGGSPWHIENAKGNTPLRHAVNTGYALMARRLELAYFRIDAARRKAIVEMSRGVRESSRVRDDGPGKVGDAARARLQKMASGRLADGSEVNAVVGGYSRPLVPSAAQVKAAAHRARFKTMFAKVDDSLKARRFTKMLKRPPDKWAESDEDEDASMDAESIATAASNRDLEADDVRATRDAAIDDWTFDPTDEAKRAAAVDAFQKRLAGSLVDL